MSPSSPKTSKIPPLESLFVIDHDILINYEGKKYPKIAFANPLHESLAFVLKDPEQAEIIQKAYARHLLPHLQEERIESFSRALVNVSFLFGSARFSPKNALLAAVRKESSSLLEYLLSHQKIFERFCQEANLPARPPIVPKKDSTYTIAILTTSASGGNFSVAHALKDFLSSMKNVRPILIDVETLAKESDLLMLATGFVTFDGVYASLFQQKNLGKEPLKKRDILSRQIGKYIPSCLGLKLKELMRQYQPDLIISTRSYTTDDIPLSTLGSPFRMFHSDYELSHYLMGLYGKADPDMLRFWLPSLEAPLFRPFFLENNRLDLYDDQEDLKTILKKMSKMIPLPTKNIERQFELLAYPIRKEISPIRDPKQKEDLRKKWNIPLGSIPILVAMGRNGAGILEELFDQIASSENGSYLQYLFVCGNNEDLKKKLSQKTVHSQPFSIYGLLSAQEWNELLNLCPVTISKPGGSMVSEILATSSYLLISHSYLWEEANGAFVERMGLGEKVDLNLSLPEQIKNCLNKKHPLPNIHNHWEKIFLDHLQKMENFNFVKPS